MASDVLLAKCEFRGLSIALTSTGQYLYLKEMWSIAAIAEPRPNSF